jgi:VIT1/CCC1 family predicted Fe2+/Mn2+ transporter
LAIFEPYNLPESLTTDITTHLEKSDPNKIVSFVMSFEHTLPEPVSSRALTCALTIALGYFIGGFVPLLPYFFTDNITKALLWSVGIMILALFLFGYVKTCFNVGWRSGRHIWQGVVGGAQMILVGGAAAGAAMGIVRAFDYHPAKG